MANFSLAHHQHIIINIIVIIHHNQCEPLDAPNFDLLVVNAVVIVSWPLPFVHLSPSVVRQLIHILDIFGYLALDNNWHC